MDPPPAASGLIDLRTDKGRQDHAIVVDVRDAGAYGHAWVSWFANEGPTRSTLSFGFYADRLGRMQEAFDTTSLMADELAREVGDDDVTRLALVVWVSDAQFEATQARLERWRGKGKYELFQRDCVTFVADVLEPIGLIMPTRLFAPRPYDFLTSVMEVNVPRSST